MKGGVLFRGTVKEPVTSFDLENLATGNYLINIRTADGKSLGSYKIVKTN
jgi:hypothetical protein